MGKYISARVALAGVAAITLAGCGSAASTSGAASGGSPAASTSGTASATTSAEATASPSGATGATGAGVSAPFPVAVGNTWIYEAVTSINNAHATDTKKVLSVTPTTGGREVMMSDTVIPGSNTATQKYLFYDNGQIGFPISSGHGITLVSGHGIVWPNAADLASGKAFHSTSKIKLTSGQYETADVTVQGGGTESVSVPAGTYQATVVNMTILTHVGSFSTTLTVKEWTAPGVGPVKTVELIKSAGKTQTTSTEALLSFKKG
ncbi:MAG TPA: hypothetical protein VFQ68_17280 [Streptosporangiaceae bacterium]|nr:hypothetical protein [Streptosporangiaceae bacterium]